MPKVKEYVKSEIVKSTTGGSGYYGIPRDTPISKDHLIAVTLYTDYTKLSSEFTACFRRKNPFENQEQVKKRNRKYWWWGRKLKEIMDVYAGYRSLRGPFYTGMSSVMTLTQFNIFLCSPTSTSVQISVAVNFSGDHGMIMEFSNDTEAAKGAMGFDCSWLSRFKEEDERHQCISIASI